MEKIFADLYRGIIDKLAALGDLYGIFISTVKQNGRIEKHMSPPLAT